MISSIVRFLKRFAILIPGVLLGYFAVKEIYPTLEERLPLVIAIWATYVVTAYVLIPFVLRLLRIVFQPKHIPMYTTSPDGFACDPVNVGVVGTKEGLMKLMKKAGWYHADRKTPFNVARMMLTIVTKQSYNNAPFSSLYLFGRSQDVGFELPVGYGTSERHHVRFWALTYDTSPKYRDHVHFWQKHHKSKSPDKILWLGAVSLDTGWGIIRHNAQITHMIDPDTNAEREFFVTELKKTGLIKKTKIIKLGKPYRTRNRVWTGYMHADGKATICEL